MTQNQSDENGRTQPTENTPEQQPPPRKRKKRRLLLKIVATVIVLIILLVILAPTILSTGVVREMVVGQINSSELNGKLNIKDWSFGWTSGIRIDGVELTDADNEHLVSAAEIDVPVSLLKAAMGKFDLGNVVVSGVDFNAVIDRNGNLNIIQAIKPSNKPSSSQPAKLPNIKGVIHLKQITGTFQDNPDRMTIGLDSKTPLNATITIKDINQPIEDTVDLGLQLQERNLVNVKVSGTLLAIRNNLVAVDHLAANQTIELSNGDLAPLAQVLLARGLNLNVTGTIGGKITATVNTPDNISANAGIEVADLSSGGGELAGDAVAFRSVRIGLKASMTGGKNAAIKLDLPITAQPNGSAQADQITLHADVPEDSLLQTADVFKAIAARLTQGTSSATAETVAIAGAGKVEISADLNVANLVSQLPHLTHLESGTALVSGRLTHETTVTLADGQAVIASETHLKDFSGTNAGQPVRLADIDASAALTAVGGSQPDLRDIKLSLTSPLVNIQGGGETLGKINFNGKSDLKTVQQQLDQIVDLDALLRAPAGSHVSMDGSLAFNLHANGDLTAADSNVAAGANFVASHVRIDIPGRRPIDEPNLNAQIFGALHHTSGQFVQAVRNLTVMLVSPAMSFQMNAAVDFGGKFGVSIPLFDIEEGSIDPRLLQEEFGGALSLFIAPPQEGMPPNLVQRLADNSAKIASGSITISGKGEFDQSSFGFQQPLAVEISPMDLTVADEMGTVQTVHLPQMSLVISGNGALSDQNVATVKNLMLAMQVGSPQSRLVELQFSSDVSVASGGVVSAPRIELGKCDADLAGLQSTFGPLLPLVMPGQAQPPIVQAIAQDLVTCTSGKLTASMSGSYEPGTILSMDGKTLAISRPLTVSIANLSVQQSGGSAPINNQTLTAAVGGSVSVSDGSVHAHLQTLSLRLGDMLEVEGSPSAPLDVALSPLAASGSVRLAGADLPKLIKLAAIALPPQQAASLNQLTSGNVSGTINLQPGENATAASADFSVNALTIGQILNDETIHLTAGAMVAGDMSWVRDVSVAIETSFAKKITITNGQIVLQQRRGDMLAPVGPFDMVQSVHAEVDKLDLAKVDAIANLLFAKAAAPPGETAIVVVPPPQVTGGVASLKADISRSGNATTVNVSDVLVRGLSMAMRGNDIVWPNDITARLMAEVDTGPDATGQMPLLDQLAQAAVTALSVDTGMGTRIGLADQKAVVLTNLSDPANMTVQGGISIDGEIAPAARIAEAFSGVKANSYPYEGHFHLDESVAKVASQPRMHIAGGGAITKFMVLGQPPAGGGPAPVAFSEDKISISNPLDFDFQTFSVIVDRANPIAISLESTGVLGVQVTGTVNDVILTRQISDDNPVAIQLTYDLAKLWKIVKPMLSPSQQQSLADLKISGRQQRTFTVSGSYPADKPSNEAVAMIRVGGFFTVDNLSTQGITIQNLDVPLCLKDGVLRTVYADQPEGQNAPKPATCNQGTLDIGVLSVDLRSDPMLLTMEGADPNQPHDLLRDVSLNPAMAKTFMGKVLNNPAFVNASDSRGLVSVSVLQLRRIPLSGLMLQSSPQNQGFAEVQYSVRELQIGSELLAVFGNSSVSAQIDHADVKMQNGRVTEDTTLMIDQDKPLRFAGVVILASEQFAPMTAYIPSALFARLVPANVRGYVPDQVIVPLDGDMNHPKLKLDKAIAETVKKGAGKAIMNGLLQGLGRAGRR